MKFESYEGKKTLSAYDFSKEEVINLFIKKKKASYHFLKKIILTKMIINASRNINSDMRFIPCI
jgi:hypothetical protein